MPVHVSRNPRKNAILTAGEALAVVWGLRHAGFFTLSNKKLIVVTDHQALTVILCDRDLGSIKSTRLRNPKEKTLDFEFSIQYNPSCGTGVLSTECLPSSTPRATNARKWP